MDKWLTIHHVQLRSISHSAYDLLLGPSSSPKLIKARMLACFRRALNLIVGNTVVALVTPELGNGPFHLVVAPLPPPLPGGLHPVRWEPELLHIGNWALHYGQATDIWDPRPNWSEIRIGAGQRQCLHHAITSVARGNTAVSNGPLESSMSQFSGCVKRLAQAALSLDIPGVQSAAGALCGLGPGLTPSGDDYLAGAMLALWAGHHPRRDTLCQAILESVAGQTTTLSEAFLVAAARGEASEHWHALISAISNISINELVGIKETEGYQRTRRAVSAISTFGATSGMDMLAGFEAGLAWCYKTPQ